MATSDHLQCVLNSFSCEAKSVKFWADYNDNDNDDNDDNDDYNFRVQKVRRREHPMLPAHAHFHTCESIGKNSRDQSLVCLLSVQTRQTVPPVSVSLLCISNGQRTVCDNLRHPSGTGY